MKLNIVPFVLIDFSVHQIYDDIGIKYYNRLIIYQRQLNNL